MISVQCVIECSLGQSHQHRSMSSVHFVLVHASKKCYHINADVRKKNLYMYI